MINIIFAMLVIVIEDLEMQLGNLNLLLGKSVIWFEPSVQKRETDKQMVGILFYYY